MSFPHNTFVQRQVISKVGDLIGIKYFPAAPNKQEEGEKDGIKIQKGLEYA